MREEVLNYNETARRFEVNSQLRIQDWERIYLTESPEGFAIEEDLLAEVQRLRAENAYLKNLQALVLEEERRQHKKTLVTQELRREFSLGLLLSITQLPRVREAE